MGQEEEQRRNLFAENAAKRNRLSEPLNILLVDDQEENLLALQGILGDLGHNLVLASSGREALREMLHRDIALVLLDVRMPGMDGFETAGLLRERERSRAVPIIFLTAAMADEEMIYMGYSAGAVDYIVKPFVPEILRAKVEVFLQLAAGRRELEEEVRRRRRAEAELQNNAERLRLRASELEVANQDLEAFAYSAYHDLRGPLRRISGFVELLLEGGHALDDDSRDYLTRISGSARKMDRLLDDLLNFSRVGREALQRSEVCLETVVEEIIEDIGSKSGDREIHWKRNPLPKVNGDWAMLRLVLTNLISNAVKYSGSRNPAKIEIGAKNGEREVVVYVKDNGAGFDMQHADKLFGVFQRLHREDEFEGTGIGLANVRRIVHRHGGRTWAEGQVGKGATFSFSLPRECSEETPTPESLLT